MEPTGDCGCGPPTTSFALDFPLGTCQWAIGKNWHLSPPPQIKDHQGSVQVVISDTCVCVYVCVYIYICLSDSSHGVSGKFLSPFFRTCRGRWGWIQRRGIMAGSSVSFGKARKGNLKTEHCFLGRPCCVVEDSEESPKWCIVYCCENKWPHQFIMLMLWKSEIDSTGIRPRCQST